MKKFVQLYAESGSITEAARVAGIERKSHYRLLEKDPVYRESFSWACRQIGEDLEYSAIQQAKDGNATLMLNLLKRFLPDEYARVSNGVEISISLTQRMEEANQRLIEMYPDDQG